MIEFKPYGTGPWTTYEATVHGVSFLVYRTNSEGDWLLTCSTLGLRGVVLPRQEIGRLEDKQAQALALACLRGFAIAQAKELGELAQSLEAEFGSWTEGKKVRLTVEDNAVKPFAQEDADGDDPATD